MTPDRAVQILGAGAAASSEERHRVFAEKRAMFEKKLGQAPTPGLQAKYRAALAVIAEHEKLPHPPRTDR